MSKRHFKPLKILYCVIGIAFLIYSGYVVGVLVLHIWHKAPHGDHAATDTIKEKELYKTMVKGLEIEVGEASFKKLDDADRLYDYHKSESKTAFDSQNLCISCHGDIPHYKKKETRAFLNMHAFFMACETCHIRAENRMETKFIWYNKISGKEIRKINLDHFLGNTNYKIMPVKRDGSKIYATEKMVKYVDEFKLNVAGMLSAEKITGLENIHKPIVEIKNSVGCNECHKSDSYTAYLPFKQIGYPERRTNQLVGNEVVGMIDKYKKFYLPTFMTPKKEADSEE